MCVESAPQSIKGPVADVQRRPLVLLPPMRISGMAMPNGVYLSNGFVRSGTDVGLLASMIGLAIGYGLASVIVTFLAWAVGGLVPAPLLAIKMGATLPGEVPGEVYWLLGIQTVHFVVFFSLLRASPLAGYHAAEHMTVHAIESGQELNEENVRRMSRVHVRCGTNILAWLLPALIVLSTQRHWPLLVSVPVALLVGMLLRHHIGSALQFLFTTKSPTRKQLLAGIDSGESLLRLFREQHGAPLPRWRVWWNRGLLQMLLLLVALVALQVAFIPYLDTHYYRWLQVGLPGG